MDIIANIAKEIFENQEQDRSDILVVNPMMDEVGDAIDYSIYVKVFDPIKSKLPGRSFIDSQISLDLTRTKDELLEVDQRTAQAFKENEDQKQTSNEPLTIKTEN